MESRELKDCLLSRGATLVGIGDVTRALATEIMHLNRGIAIAVNRSLNRETVLQLAALQQRAAEWLKDRGFRAFPIPPDSDRIHDKFIARLYRLFCHKTAATCAGLGWVGKNGLIINRQYGSKLSWATVLTNAPLDADEPVTASECGDCDLCVRHCPSGAISGCQWTIQEPLREMVRYEQCRSLKKDRIGFDEKPNCGFCITVCPYSRNARGARPEPAAAAAALEPC